VAEEPGVRLQVVPAVAALALMVAAMALTVAMWPGVA